MRPVRAAAAAGQCSSYNIRKWQLQHLCSSNHITFAKRPPQTQQQSLPQ
jgi:hypothetical protein